MARTTDELLAAGQAPGRRVVHDRRTDTRREVKAYTRVAAA